MGWANCPSREVLVGYRSGQLDDTSSRAVCDHVATCLSCQAALQSMVDPSEVPHSVVRSHSPRQAVDESTDATSAATTGPGSVSHQPDNQCQIAEHPESSVIRQVGGCQLFEIISDSGMATVYRPRHARLNRPVVVKLLRDNLLQEPKALLRFRREMAAAGALEHPNVVWASHAGEHEGTPYIVMEYVDGLNLSQIVTRCGPLQVADTCEIVRQAALGLQCIFEHGMVHRDIKPSNVMLSCDGVVKILDLGIARLSAQELGMVEQITETAIALGTADYMAPEQISDARLVDIRADIYSLGCTLYELLSGRPPFCDGQHRTTVKKLLAHGRETAPPLQRERPDVPYKLARILDRMLAKDRSVRFSTPAELVDALRSFSEGADLTALLSQSQHATDRSGRAAAAATPSGHAGETRRTGSLWSRKQRSPAQRRALVLVAGAAAIVLLLAGIMLFWHTKHPMSHSETHRPAISPVAPRQARIYQEAWAKYLGLPIDYTNTIGMKVILIPPGEFDMGSTPEDVDLLLVEAQQRNEPQWLVDLLHCESVRHRVRVTRAFYLGACAVTVSQFRQFVADAGYVTEAETDGKGGLGVDASGQWLQNPEWTWRQPGFEQNDDHPVVQVSWSDASAFCEWLSRKEGKTYRLPTEAEWEYACRAGSTTKWSFGNEEPELGEYAWYADGTQGGTRPVCQKKPNAFGLYDMHGNVWQWSADWYDEDYYQNSPFNDPAGPITGSDRVGRGGAWTSSAAGCRSAYRSRAAPDFRKDDLGFRVVLMTDPTGPESKAVSEAAEGMLGVVVNESGAPVEVVGGQSATTSAENKEPLAGLGPEPRMAGSRYVDQDGKWQLPPGAPSPAIAPFDAQNAKEHQEAWAKHLGLPVDHINSIGMKFILIPPGQFDMGSTPEDVEVLLAEAQQRNEPQWYVDVLHSEVPRHRVRIARAFRLGACEVTVGQFRQFIADTGYLTEAETDGKGGFGVDAAFQWLQNPEWTWRQPGSEQSDDHPVVQVSWSDAFAFCEWLSRKEGATYRLPTEAEWEYACRAGSTTKWCCGNGESELGEYAWYADGAQGGTRPVCQKKPNAFGLYDMHGNVLEWCADWYDESYYTKSPANKPAGPICGSDRVHRGGDWRSPASFCRSALRYRCLPFLRSMCLGFRVAAIPSPGRTSPVSPGPEVENGTPEASKSTVQ